MTAAAAASLEGRTTRAIKEAPHRSVFICRETDLSYVRDLVRHVGRTDLEIVPLPRLRRRVVTLSPVPITVDHRAAAMADAQQLDDIHFAIQRFKRAKGIS